MAKSTATAKQARGGDSGPVSVILPGDLKARVLAEAKKRGLKLSPAVRVLLHERVQELDDAEQLSRAEEWQRAQAWATWEKLKAATVPRSRRESSMPVSTRRSNGVGRR